MLNHELNGRQPLVIYANHPDFRQTRVIAGRIDPSTGGVTEQIQRRIVLPFTGSLGETSHVIGHELVHAFQFDIVRSPASLSLPLWFAEGMAEYLSVGAGPHVDAVVGELFRQAANGPGALRAIEQLTKRSLAELSSAWHSSIRGAYGPIELKDVGAIGQTLISEEGSGGRINIGPALAAAR